MKRLKPFIGYVVAGVVGALLVLLISPYLTNPTPLSDSAESTSLVRPVSLMSHQNTPDVAVPNSFHLAAERATPSVVKIKTKQVTEYSATDSDIYRFFFGGNPQDMPMGGAGSGVIISSDGYIATNHHVIKDANEIEVILSDKRTYRAEIVGYDDRTDLAVLKIEASNLPTLDYADSDDLEIGDWVLAIGNPFEFLTSTVTAGIISAKGRNINILHGQSNIEAFLQTDAAVNPGNSGGALVDAEGRLVGINTAIASSTGVFSGYSFAIPVNLMKKIVQDIIEYGSYKRAIMGVAIMEINHIVADELNLDVTKGVLVNQVIPGGAADQAGLEVNDVILSVNGRTIHSVPQLQEMIGGHRAGDVVEVETIRSGKKSSVQMRLQEE